MDSRVTLNMWRKSKLASRLRECHEERERYRNVPKTAISHHVVRNLKIFEQRKKTKTHLTLLNR
jgi:hypothetical protein